MFEISNNLKINLDSVISVNKVQDKWKIPTRCVE